MKKITILLFVLFFSSLAFSQSCDQTFSAEGTDSTTVLTIESSSLSCYSGTISSIILSDADLDSYCGNWYSFSISIDGVVTNDVCSEDLEGMDITNFSEITVTVADIDDYEDDVEIELTITVNYTTTEVPNCDAALTSPVDGSIDNNLLGKLTWSAATGGAAGYILSVGTTSGGTDVVSMEDVGNVTTYDIAGLLLEGQDYFVTITAYNSIGNATACTEYNFTTITYEAGNLCENAIEVTLPFNTTDSTVNYADVYYEGTPGASGCGSSSNYLNGNDVIYAYTATFDGSISITMTPDSGNTYSGIFIYDSCANIGVECSGGVANSNAAIREIPEFSVQSGVTYYIVISTWASPQTVSYELDITENTCTSATATYAVVSDCANGDQFLIDVNVSDLGTATSLSVYDDAGNLSQTLTAPGTLTFGPYDNGTSVVMSVANDQDSSCEIMSGSLTQTACPPANDECENAEILIVNADYDCESSTSGTIAGATASTVTGNTCYGNADDDVWYSFTATSTTHRIAITNVAGSVTDLYHSLWTGTCGSLTLVSGSCSDANTSTPGALIVGQEYFVRVYTYTATPGQNTTFTICIGTPPPAPINDDCAGATAITVDEQFCDGTNNNGNNSSATDSGVENPDCFGSGTNDVWFSFVAPANTASVNISTEFLGGTLIDTQIALYSGACGTLVEEACAQDGTVLLGNGFAWNSTISDAPVTVGETYYVRVSGYTNARIGSFCLDVATNQTLANNVFDKNSFTVYPNPVKDKLNVSYVQNISDITVYNMLGQEVVFKTINATEGQMDLSNLASGTYLVKVKTDTAVQTIKIVKE